VHRTKENETKEKPRSIGAVNRELRLLSRILRLAVDGGEATENVRKKVSIFKGEQHRTRYLLPVEEQRLMIVLDDDRSPLRNMVVLAINTGLRVSEILKLKPDHVDFHRDVLYINATKTDEDRELPLNDLRHTFGTREADAGVPLNATRDVMGHKTNKFATVEVGSRF
jgi:integrase